jgi:hypothetical protein
MQIALRLLIGVPLGLGAVLLLEWLGGIEMQPVGAAVVFALSLALADVLIRLTRSVIHPNRGDREP